MPDIPLPGGDLASELTGVNETGSDSGLDPFAVGQHGNVRSHITARSRASEDELDPGDPLAKKNSDTLQHEDEDDLEGQIDGPIKIVYPLLDRSSSQESF